MEDQGRRLFIIRDHSIPGVEKTLEHLCGPGGLPDGVLHIQPGTVGQGLIGAEVRMGLSRATHVIALMDRPNANVGYELGRALGEGKPVRAGRVQRRTLPWLRRRRLLKDLMVGRLSGIQAMRQACTADDWWCFDQAVPPMGDQTLVLCPALGEGEAVLEVVEEQGLGWAVDQDFHVNELRWALDGVQRVVWVILAQHDDDRDGAENTTPRATLRTR